MEALTERRREGTDDLAAGKNQPGDRVDDGEPDGYGGPGVKVEARADAQDRRDHGGIALARAFGPRHRFVGIVQRSILLSVVARPGDAPVVARAKVR